MPIIYATYEDDPYKEDPTQHFKEMPRVGEHLLKKTKESFSQIRNTLYTLPGFINLIESMIPDTPELRAVLTASQKRQLDEGSLKLMSKKDGSPLARLINPETGRIVCDVPLQEVQMTPNLTQSLMDFSMQMQMAQIGEKIQDVQIAVNNIIKGLENDRLAIAYSSQQKFLQAVEIQDPQLKTSILLQLISSAEDSRNQLMLSQKENVNFICSQPEGFWKKLFANDHGNDVDEIMKSIHVSLRAVNDVSFTEAMAYFELGERKAAEKSLMYYSDFLRDTYTSRVGILERLDMNDSDTGLFWSNTIPDLCRKIEALPKASEQMLLEYT